MKNKDVVKNLDSEKIMFNPYKNLKDWDDEDIIGFIDYYLEGWKKFNEEYRIDSEQTLWDLEALANPIKVVLELRK